MTDYTPNILNIIKEEFTRIIAQDYDYYGKYNFVLSNEQQFVPEKDRSPHKIYIVVKFLEGTPFAGQNIIPININAIGEQNSVEVCQRLLADFVQQYNLKTSDGTGNPISSSTTSIYKQFYTTPQVVNNFNEVYAGFRTLFYVGGTFLVGESSNPITEITVSGLLPDNELYKVNFLSVQWSYDNQLDPQAYTGTHSRTKSIAKIATFSISFTIYLTNDAFCKRVLGMMLDNTGDEYAPDGNKTNFLFNITFASGLTVSEMPFKLANCTGQQNIGEFPSVSVSFTN